MWSRDAGDPEDQNIYGNHPVYLETRFEPEGNTSLSHGVFLLSSQGMDVLLRPGVVEYRVLGERFPRALMCALLSLIGSVRTRLCSQADRSTFTSPPDPHLSPSSSNTMRWSESLLSIPLGPS
jgi:hypothetical protein